MRTTQKGLELIKRFEGFSPVPYVCPSGYRTIGYGHVIRSNDGNIDRINEVEAEDLLIKDVLLVEKAIKRLIRVPLEDYQFDALVSFTFNLGSGALQSSTLRQKINREEYDSAADEFLRWVYAGGRKLKGLILRRIAERSLFLGETV